MREARHVVYCGTDRAEKRVHLARLDESRSICGLVLFDGSPFDEWQLVDDSEAEGDCPGERCFPCWEKWETEKRADREAHGEFVPAQRDHVRAPRRKVAPQVESARIAARTALEKRDELARRRPDRELIRLYADELRELGTPEAVAELERRQTKRAEKRAARAERTAA